MVFPQEYIRICALEGQLLNEKLFITSSIFCNAQGNQFIKLPKIDPINQICNRNLIVAFYEKINSSSLYKYTVTISQIV